MENKNIVINFREFQSVGELDEKYRKVAQEAVFAIEGSYAPYSNFNVGAAVLLADGTIVRGANQENVAYPSGMCAERSALYYASSAYPNTPIEAIAVVAYVNGKIADVPAYPCGSCRQAILQYELKFSKDIRVIVVGNGRVEVFDSIKSLLPFAFDTI